MCVVVFMYILRHCTSIGFLLAKTTTVVTPIISITTVETVRLFILMDGIMDKSKYRYFFMDGIMDKSIYRYFFMEGLIIQYMVRYYSNYEIK